MGLSMGIVGLPNVGKSTLFNAITNQAIEAENFPFCTIEPNQGIVPVPDPRLDVLASISNAKKIIPATIEFIDIAGLVKGASKGEGLGNKFLANIRNVSAIVHVVRCFENNDVVHVDGSVDPRRDMDVINTELLLADVDQCEKAIQNLQKRVKANNKIDVLTLEILNQCLDQLSKGTPIRSMAFSESEWELIKAYQFLTGKKVIYVCNVAEQDVSKEVPLVTIVKQAVAHEGAQVISLSAQFEHEVSQLNDADKSEFLNEYGLDASGLERLAQQSFKLLALQTFLTTGEKETRAWTIPINTLAPKAAAEIHTDFEKGFIRANVIHFDDFVQCNGYKIAREKGLIRQEGKEYLVKDGDIIEFLFNV
jgi:GTP-binding protein YchF